MRKCIRCECEMRENYDVKVEYGAYGDGCQGRI